MSPLSLLPSFVAMANGELVQIERGSFLTSAAILECVAIVEVFCRFLILNVFIIFRFLVKNTVEVSHQPFQVILKRVIHFIRRKMPPKASCCCPHHGRWGHSDLTDLRTATEPELKFCEVDKGGRHKGRKRKICTSCRNHIQLEVKCDKLEVGSCFL